MEKKSEAISEFILQLSQGIESETIGKFSPITDIDIVSDASSVVESDLSFEMPEKREPDIKFLQQHLSELEQLSKTDTSGNLQHEIDSVRNQISKIRSTQAIKSSLSNQKRFDFNVRSQRCSLTESKYTKLIIPSSTPKFKSNPFDFNREMASTPKPTNRGFNFAEIVGNADEEQNAIRRVFRVKELKFKEKEENFEKEKEKFLNSWKKLPNANELIPLVQKEIIDLRNSREDFRKKAEMTERKELQLIQKISDYNKKQKDLQEKSQNLEDQKEKLFDEKSNLLRQLEQLRKSLESIS